MIGPDRYRVGSRFIPVLGFKSVSAIIGHAFRWIRLCLFGDSFGQVRTIRQLRIYEPSRVLRDGSLTMTA